MALRPSKATLLAHVEEGLQEGGWNILYLSKKGQHPARYRIYRNGTAFTVRVYIWNVTHGGGPRSAEEFRIQITGITPNQFAPEVGGKTLILGWWDKDEVFSGFDYRRHSGPLGGSPSMQIALSTLEAAAINRFAAHRKTNGEVAVAFRPEFIGTYAENLEELHDSGKAPKEVALLNQAAEDPTDQDSEEIASQVAAPRRKAIVQTVKTLRALDFGDRTLKAYGQRCALCGLQLRLLDGAHILPVADPESTDETGNGIALCPTHHRAYDRGLVTFDTAHKIHIHEPRLQELHQQGLDGGAGAFRSGLRNTIILPPEKSHRPHGEFVKKANQLRGWSLT